MPHRRSSLPMPRLVLAVVGAVLAVALTPSSAAATRTMPQDEPKAARVACRSCDNRGERPCTKHRKFLELEQAVRFCSVAAACKKCEGALATDCKICTNQAVEQSAEARRALAKQWRAARRKTVDDYTRGHGEDFMHVETEHVDLTFDAHKLTVGRKKLDNHALMHLYAERIEALRTHFMTTFELDDADFPEVDVEQQVSPRLRIWVVKDPADQRLVAPRVTGIGSSGAGVKLMGGAVAYCVQHDRKLLPDDEALHRNIAHALGHLLLSNALPCDWVGNRGHGWIDEGVAHWLEYTVDEKCTNFCYEEIGLRPGAGFKGGHWRVAVRKIVETGKLRPFAEVYQLNSDQLDFAAHAQAFAYVEFLIREFGGPKFMDMVRKVKAKVPTRKALQEVYGFGPLQFDERLVAWVKQHYPKRR